MPHYFKPISTPRSLPWTKEQRVTVSCWPSPAWSENDAAVGYRAMNRCSLKEHLHPRCVGDFRRLVDSQLTPTDRSGRVERKWSQPAARILPNVARSK